MQLLKKDEVLRYLGYKGQEISPEIDQKIDYYMSYIISKCNPNYTYIISDVSIESDKISLQNSNLSLSGKDIKKHLSGADKCVILACTLGAGFDMELRKLQAKSMTDAVIFDATGTAYIEAFTDRCEEKILNPLKEDGYFSNFRYSPGYGDLPISLQGDVLASLDAPKKIGLTVTESGLLLPQKSITAFIGIFSTPQKKPISKCENCSNKDTCLMRKDGNLCD